MKEVYIVSVARTPIGNLGGVLSTVPAIDLGKTAVSAAIERSGLNADQINEVFIGNVLSANVGQAPAKQVSLASGIPNTVPCTTINKVCSSGMKAIMLGAQSIMLGDNDVVVAGGMESMSAAPHYIPSGRAGIRYGDGKILDAISRDGLQDPYNGDMMGVCGEVCAEGKNISKAEQDAYAHASYARAREAYEKGYFNDELVNVSVPRRRKDPLIISQDEEVGNTRVTDLASVENQDTEINKSERYFPVTIKAENGNLIDGNVEIGQFDFFLNI